jgi:hypothetical protein
VDFLVSGGEDSICSHVHLHALIPTRPSPFRPRSVHVAYQIGIVGYESVGSDDRW